MLRAPPGFRALALSDFPVDVSYVQAFGAKCDGTTNDASAIQSAIDACNESGGGQVIVPAGGVYLSGTITLNADRTSQLKCTARAQPDAADVIKKNLNLVCPAT